MKALRLFEKPERHITLAEIPKPELKPGQVLVRMKAAALNRRDQWIRVGKYPGIKASTLGSDGCGIVEAQADDISGDLIGKRVIINPNNNWGENPEHQAKDYHILGMPTDGTFAEYIAVNQDRIADAPEHLSDTEAAALPLAGLTAYRAAFTHARIREGDKVLVTGMGGGVSQFAMQFAVKAGAEVYVTSSSQEKLQKALELGAKSGFNYKADGWEEALKGRSGQLNAIIDSAGGDQFGELVNMLGRSGKLVFYGATNGLPGKIDLYRMFFNQVTIQGSTMGNDQEFSDMSDFVSAHKIRPVISSVHSFENIVSAFDEMRDGKQFGKITVSFDK